MATLAMGMDDVPTLTEDTAGMWTVAAITARMKAEIIEDVRTGRVPAVVASFSELHDFVDANDYGGLTLDAAPRSSWEVSWPADVIAACEAFANVSNDAQDFIDRWLRDEGLLEALGAVVMYARLTFIPEDNLTLDPVDVARSTYVRLEEVYVGPDNFPITPKVAFIDGPLSSLDTDDKRVPQDI